MINVATDKSSKASIFAVISSPDFRPYIVCLNLRHNIVTALLYSEPSVGYFSAFRKSTE